MIKSGNTKSILFYRYHDNSYKTSALVHACTQVKKQKQTQGRAAEWILAQKTNDNNIVPATVFAYKN